MLGGTLSKHPQAEFHKGYLTRGHCTYSMKDHISSFKLIEYGIYNIIKEAPFEIKLSSFHQIVKSKQMLDSK